VLSDTESETDRAGIGQLWRFMTQAGVASLTEIAKSSDPLARDGALDALSQLRARRPDLEIDAALVANMMAPGDEPDGDDAEADAPDAGEVEANVPQAEPEPVEMTPDPETHLVSL
jgi:hypothetical protein